MTSRKLLCILPIIAVLAASCAQKQNNNRKNRLTKLTKGTLQKIAKQAGENLEKAQPKAEVVTQKCRITNNISDEQKNEKFCDSIQVIADKEGKLDFGKNLMGLTNLGDIVILDDANAEQTFSSNDACTEVTASANTIENKKDSAGNTIQVLRLTYKLPMKASLIKTDENGKNAITVRIGLELVNQDFFKISINKDTDELFLSLTGVHDNNLISNSLTDSDIKVTYALK
ncbi:MAG: hypothetical protein A2Z20_05500 [Bdellovibrionales bacterium RBG_16_40_8]|nr:MAG: hypothetical protein A2Z20_05500 [Bdellovibrionales bacterium RBG_16_40_8]